MMLKYILRVSYKLKHVACQVLDVENEERYNVCSCHVPENVHANQMVPRTLDVNYTN